MTDEMNRLFDESLFDGETPDDPLFSPSSDPENGSADDAGNRPEISLAETDKAAASEPNDGSSAVRVFDWDEREPLDEDELFGQIGQPDAENLSDVPDLFDNDGPDAELPEEGFSEAPAVAPTQVSGIKTDGTAPLTLPPAKEKKELTEKDLIVRRKYALQRIGTARVRLCFAILFSLMILVVECFSVFGIDVTRPLGVSRVPGAAALLDLQLILLVAYCSWRSLYAGLRSVLHRRFRAEVLLIVALIAVVWYDIVAYLGAGKETTLVALPLAVALTASTWVEWLEWETRYRTVQMLEYRGVKYAAIDGSGDDGDRLVLAPVRYVDGYDGEINSYREDAGFQLLLAFLSIGVAVGGFLTVLIGSDAGIVRAFSVGISVLLLSCPFAALLARRILYTDLAQAFLDGGTAVIGEEAAFRYANVTTFSVEDGDAFSGEETRIRIVNVFRDSRLDEILRLLSSVYSKIGGPLSRVLSEATNGNAFSDEATIVEIVSGGVKAVVNDRTVYVGSGEYMAQNSFPLPEVDVDKVLKNDRMCVLFVAYDGEVRARFYLEYVLSRAFETRAEKLRKLGVSTEIRTFDPCLTPAYFSHVSYLPDESVRIKRMALSDLDEEEVRRAESGLFALGSLSTMLDALLAFRRYARARGILGFLKFTQFLVGAAASAFFLIRFPETPIPTWASAIYGLTLILISIWRGYVAGKSISSGMRNARQLEGK